MGLSVPRYGIYGANVQTSLSKAVSPGFIRLGLYDVEALFAQVKVGTKVEISALRNEGMIALFGEPARPPVVHAPVSTGGRVGPQGYWRSGSAVMRAAMRRVLELITEFLSLVRALRLSVACGVLMEELMVGGLVRLILARQHEARAVAEQR